MLKNCGDFVSSGLYLNNHITELAETLEFDFAGPNLPGEKFLTQLELFLLLVEVDKGLMWWGFRIFWCGFTPDRGMTGVKRNHNNHNSCNKKCKRRAPGLKI